jgi:hypothetical protein
MEPSEVLREAVRQAAVERDGRTILPCAQAFKIAEQLGETLSAVGQACNDANVRIAQCQLGCFK